MHLSSPFTIIICEGLFNKTESCCGETYVSPVQYVEAHAQ